MYSIENNHMGSTHNRDRQQDWRRNFKQILINKFIASFR